jgi:two-component system heavy metal sensor histidine kinase CusS
MKLKIESDAQGNTLTFIDEGIGIPENDLPHIFQPFYRASNSTSSRGHGIGLSLVHKIIQIHNGEIKVESKLLQGTRFIVFLPSHSV